MITRQLDNGILNAYATEPEMRYAIAPSTEQRSTYRLQAGLALLFVSTLTAIAVAVS